jgi:CPA1 family monovalent cation:H+ antiporter
MSGLLVSGLVVAGVVALTPLAKRAGLPQPVLLAIFGICLGLLPGTGPVPVPPEHVLPLVLPPLLFAATLRSTVHEFRREVRPIALLAVGLTLATAVAVTLAARALGLGWPVAAVLGAVVSPPDPVAATAVARRLSLPPRLVVLLEGEGLFNDATALVLYAVAVSALVTGEVTAGDVALRLVLTVVVGTAVGLAGGQLTRMALAHLHQEAAEATLTLAVPFVVYLVADHFGGSGVLAVLALGLYLRSRGHAAITAGGWLLGRAVWRFLDYLVTSVVFVLLGMELMAVLSSAGISADVVRLTAAVVAVVVLLRLVWLLPALRLVREDGPAGAVRPFGVRETVVAGWAGMRGVVTVAAVLSVPHETADGSHLSGRSTLVIVALATVVVTLVVQGLTLPGLVKALGVGRPADTGSEAADLYRRALRGALDAVHSVADEDLPDGVRRAVARRYENDLATQEAIGAALAPPRDEGEAEDDDRRRQALRRLARVAGDAEREVVLRARATGEVPAEVADEVLTRVEARVARRDQG